MFALLLLTTLATTYQATPATFDTELAKLHAGDTLEMAAGTYPHFSLSGLNGTDQAWITITGPISGAPAIVEADSGPCCNTIEISGSSYLALKHLTIDNKGVQGAFAISATGNSVHHIRIEDNRLVFTNADQQDVGISTKGPTWGWEIRRNVIEAAGTGMYLGNSDGTLPFVQGLIEHNVIVNTVGYNMQIKHQNAWPTGLGLPTGMTRTVIRHNVFIKDGRASPDGDRPNLLVGGWPDTGEGSQNRYEVYGNLFFENPREALFQATGNVSVHDNLFIKSTGSALVFTNHQGKTMKLAYAYHNTFVTPGTAVVFGSAASVDDLVTGNLFLAGTATSGTIQHASDNLSAPYAQAAQYVKSPTLTLPGLDLFPLAGKAQGTAIDLSKVMNEVAPLLDFNGQSKGARLFRGAYASEGTNPGWAPVQGIKTLVTSTGGGGGSSVDAGTGGGSGGGGGGGSAMTGGGGGSGGGSSADAGTTDAGVSGPDPSPQGCGCSGAHGWLLGTLSLLLFVKRRRFTA